MCPVTQDHIYTAGSRVDANSLGVFAGSKIAGPGWWQPQAYCSGQSYHGTWPMVSCVSKLFFVVRSRQFAVAWSCTWCEYVVMRRLRFVPWIVVRPVEISRATKARPLFLQRATELRVGQRRLCSRRHGRSQAILLCNSWRDGRQLNRGSKMTILLVCRMSAGFGGVGALQLDERIKSESV